MRARRCLTVHGLIVSLARRRSRAHPAGAVPFPFAKSSDPPSAPEPAMPRMIPSARPVLACIAVGTLLFALPFAAAAELPAPPIGPLIPAVEAAPRPYPYAILDLQPGDGALHVQGLIEERMMIELVRADRLPPLPHGRRPDRAHGYRQPRRAHRRPPDHPPALLLHRPPAPRESLREDLRQGLRAHGPQAQAFLLGARLRRRPTIISTPSPVSALRWQTGSSSRNGARRSVAA